MITKEKAPRTRGSTFISARSRSRPSLSRPSPSARMASDMSSATTSLSLVTVPLRVPVWPASSAVLTRLPLWPRAKPASPTERKMGWALSHELEPVVE